MKNPVSITDAANAVFQYLWEQDTPSLLECDDPEIQEAIIRQALRYTLEPIHGPLAFSQEDMDALCKTVLGFQKQFDEAIAQDDLRHGYKPDAERSKNVTDLNLDELASAICIYFFRNKFGKIEEDNGFTFITQPPCTLYDFDEAIREALEQECKKAINDPKILEPLKAKVRERHNAFIDQCNVMDKRLLELPTSVPM